jgi:DNA transposase THAP9
MFCSPTLSSPGTTSYVSSLINLPSPQTNKLQTNNNALNSSNNLSILNKKLQEKCLNLQKLLKRKRAVISYLQKKNKNSKKNKIKMSQLLHKFSFSSMSSKALVTMQVLHKMRKPWSKMEKKLAMSLYYKSPSTFKYMRKNKIVLPGESTVRRWLNSISYKTGFSQKYTEQLKLKAECMSFKEKKCVILLDEVAIKKYIEYNKVLDEIEGFEDLGSLGKSLTIGSHALVVMIRGLYVNWKIPLSYYFTGSGIKGDNLVLIVKECVQKILELGFLPSAIICDQGTQNRRMFSILGGSEINPFTTIYNQKLFLIYDMPHLIKSVRNNLLNGDFKIGKNIISLKDVKKTYEIDRTKSKVRAMCKITPIHFSPNAFQKMSCKFAIQLLSRSVAAVIKTCVATGELESLTAINTANFFITVNDMFDSGNSKILFDNNPNKRPMNEKNPQVFINFKNAISTFKNIIKIGHKNQKNSTPPCFSGIVWTSTAMLELYKSEKLEMNEKYPEKQFFIMTNRLTQDPLENFFSVIRQKNGYNRNPTARTFRCSFGNICAYSLMKCSDKCNCEDDDDELLTVDIINTSKNLSKYDVIVTSDSENQQNTSISSDNSSDISTCSFSNPEFISPSLETCTIVYYAGYLANKCINKFKCDNCRLNLITEKNLNDETQLLLAFKTFDDIENNIEKGLKMPTSTLLEITDICLSIFNKTFNEIKNQKKLVAQLMQNATKKIIKKTIILNSPCKDHYLYIMELLFITKIYKETKWINAELQNKTSQEIDKLRIFKHN